MSRKKQPIRENEDKPESSRFDRRLTQVDPQFFQMLAELHSCPNCHFQCVCEGRDSGSGDLLTGTRVKDEATDGSDDGRDICPHSSDPFLEPVHVLWG